MNPWITLKTTIFTHRPRASVARFPFCWWRHNRLPITSKWPDNWDASTWKVISNSLDIYFIHDRSWKGVNKSRGLGEADTITTTKEATINDRTILWGVVYIWELDQCYTWTLKQFRNFKWAYSCLYKLRANRCPYNVSYNGMVIMLISLYWTLLWVGPSISTGTALVIQKCVPINQTWNER